jgi:hypothetical protein
MKKNMIIDKIEIYKNSDPFVGFPREYISIRIHTYTRNT